MSKKESLDKLTNFLQSAIFVLFAVIVGLVGCVVVHFGRMRLGFLIVCLIAVLVLTSMFAMTFVLFIKKLKEMEDV